MTDQWEPPTEEDWARVDALLDHLQIISDHPQVAADADALARVLTHIVRLEADQPKWVDPEGREWSEIDLAENTGWVPSLVADNLRARIDDLEAAYREHCHTGNTSGYRCARGGIGCPLTHDGIPATSRAERRFR